MTNSSALRALIKSSGLKYQHIAKKIGVSAYTLTKKIDNITEFKASEIVIICEMLHIEEPSEKERLFFACL